LLKNPDKVPYLINHSSKESYPEKLFREGLTRENLTGWTQSFRISLYEYDFAFLGQKIDVEIDGSTHLQEKVKKIDKKRDEFSRSHGWKVIRFTAKEVKEDLNGCLKRLMNAL
jgi:very-short-patch-repair endonuclease